MSWKDNDKDPLVDSAGYRATESYGQYDPYRYRFGGPHPLTAGLVAQYLPPRDCEVLEIGSADGILARRVIDVVNALRDVSETQIRRNVKRYYGMELTNAWQDAQAIADDVGAPCTFFEGDIDNDGDWPSRRFDMVVVSNLLPYADRRETLAKEIFDRLLNDDGVLVLVGWLRHDGATRTYFGDWPKELVRAKGSFMVEQVIAGTEVERGLQEHSEDTPMGSYCYEFCVVGKKPQSGRDNDENLYIGWGL